MIWEISFYAVDERAGGVCFADRNAVEPEDRPFVEFECGKPIDVNGE